MRFGNWNANKECSSATASRFEIEPAPNDPEAFLDSNQSQPSIAISRRAHFDRIEPAPIILDNCLNMIRGAAENESDLSGSRMFCDVVKRFLNDPVHGRFRSERTRAHHPR